MIVAANGMNEDSRYGAGSLAMSAEYYSWTAPELPGGNAEVRLDFDLIDRLLQEVMRGFGAMPRRSLEMGGLLIGWVEQEGDRRVITIEDFEPIPCRHSKGTAWLLTAEEQIRFEETLARWRNAEGRRSYTVGFYRSHTREGMGLTAEDQAMFSRFFPDPSSIVMLVKPFATRSSVGAIFVRDGHGGLRTTSSYREFPFSRKDLGGAGLALSPPEETAERPGGAPPFREPAPAAFPPPPPPPAYGQPAFPPFAQFPQEDTTPRGAQMASATVTPISPITSDQLQFGLPSARKDDVTGKRTKTGWVWIPLSLVFLLFGVVLGFQLAVSVRSQLPAAMRQDPYTLGLSVALAGESLHVRWERTAPAVQGSSRAVLHINDGGNSKIVQLDGPQLQNGSVIYRKASNDVKFKLEVFARDRVTVAESAEFRQQ